MKLLNLFLIFIILYLIYKIVIHNEGFEIIDLSGKDIINSRNIFMNLDESRIEEINKIPELDLNKNNLIIDNRYGNKISITDKLCVGNYCINSDKLKLLIGDIDGPQFYNTKNGSPDELEPVYYNHDCDIGVDNSNSFKCNINKNIDYPDKLCFNSLDDAKNKNEPTCIGPNQFDVLKGIRGIKLKHVESQPEKITDKDPTQYMSPYYIDFKQSGYNLEGTKDQLFFKNNAECLTKDLLYKKNDDDWDPKKFPYFKDIDHEINCDDSPCDTWERYMCPHKCKIDTDSNPLKKSKITDDDGGHGYYYPTIDTKYKTDIDDKYTGYFLSRLNNNTKYNLKENAVSRVSKFLGDSLHTHGFSGEEVGDDCFSVDVPANKKYYCDGKNSSSTAKKEQICNPVYHKKDNIRKCINDKVSDALDDDSNPTVYTSFELAKIENPKYYDACVVENPSVNEDNSVIPNTNTNNKNKDISLNYVMTPAKDINGNNINANTYFHGHSHIHK
jgi:hypothetical protein